MNIRGQLDGLVDALDGVGITASAEAQDVPVPGSWLACRQLEKINRCLYALTVDVYLIVPDAGPLVALDNLGTMLTSALSVLPAPAYAVDLAAAVILPHDGTPLPAFRIPITLDIGD